MFKKLHFNISFAEALTQMPEYAKMLKDLLTNKEKLIGLANTPLIKNFSVVLLKKLPDKLRDPRKFLIPCNFSELEECLVVADLGVSINLMPLSIWKKLMLPKLIPTRVTLELANRSVAYPVGIGKDVFVGKFRFPADFIVIDYDVNPHVPFILGRPFLRTNHALVDVHREDLNLRVGDEKLTFNVKSTLIYPYTHGDDPTPSFDPVVVSLSSSLTSFGDSDFLLKVTNAFLALDDSIPPDIDNGVYDSEGDILFLEKLLNSDPIKDLPPKELKNDETKTTKSSIKEPHELELKDLPPHLEYAFLEGTSKLPVIITKGLKREEKDHLIKVLKSHKRAITWKISNIRGIDPNFCIYKILMEDDFKPVVQHQRRVNPKLHELIEEEVIKLLDAGLIYPIVDCPWVSLCASYQRNVLGMNSIVFLMVFLGISKFLSILKTKKKPPSPALDDTFSRMTSESWRLCLDQPSSLKTQRNTSLVTTMENGDAILALLPLVDVCACLIPYREILGDMITRTIDQASGGNLRDKNDEESWALLEDLTLYDNKSWNDPRDFAKPVKAICMPHNVTSAFDRRLIKLENQVQQDPEQAFVDYASTRIDEAGNKWFEADFKQYQSEVTNKLDTFLKAFNYQMTRLLSSGTVKNPKLNTNPTSSARSHPARDPQSSSNSFKSVNAIQTLEYYKPFDTLADLGSCVNLLPLKLFNELEVGLLEETDDVLGLADGTKLYFVGIVRNVEVHIGKLKLFKDFHVVDVEREPTCPLLVGRGFLATANAVIDCKKAKIMVGEGLTRSIFEVKELDFGDDNEPY
nr:reverse transcriptase domain-containing protein [Tanacetum cinerariifolium]